jgi:hypothetical protein
MNNDADEDAEREQLCQEVLGKFRQLPPLMVMNEAARFVLVVRARQDGQCYGCLYAAQMAYKKWFTDDLVEEAVALP